MGYGLAVAALGIGVATIVHRRVYQTYHYVCHSCGQKFKPASFAKSMFALNNFDQRRIRCTKCGKAGWNLAERDSN
jgi:DNA-directed RNA polymerase subunit RPC12/RpoP